MQAILIPGTYLLPGIGEVLITTILAVFLGKAAMQAGTEIFNKVEQRLAIHFSKKLKKSKKMFHKE